MMVLARPLRHSHTFTGQRRSFSLSAHLISPISVYLFRHRILLSFLPLAFFQRHPRFLGSPRLKWTSKSIHYKKLTTVTSCTCFKYAHNCFCLIFFSDIFIVKQPHFTINPSLNTLSDFRRNTRNIL